MKAKLIINNQEIEIEISEKEYKKLQPEKKTGYERVSHGDQFYWVDSDNVVVPEEELDFSEDVDWYEAANYYSSDEVALNNARADKLMRQLRRFAVEHRKKEIDWHCYYSKYYITYCHDEQKLSIESCVYWHVVGTIVFDTEKTAQLAIDTFKDELIWYFTEYKNSL